MRLRRTECSVCLLLALAATFLAPRDGAAHFALRAPESWRVQDGLGNPQKTGPCGDEGSAAETGAITPFSPGETITITLDETIHHPGHYRVALAVNDRSELPAPPPVTPGDTDCGTVPIMMPAVFPVLADGMLEHTTPFSGTQSFQVTLPTDVTCTRCTLQVLEFMSDHGAPCFYHHCADVSILPSGGPCESDLECADDDACTVDTCDAKAGCVTRPLGLADVGEDFLGALETPACAGDEIPPFAGKLLGKATLLVARAVDTPSKARRFLTRASRKLGKAMRKVARTQGRSISAECGTALDTLLAQADGRVRCLLGGD
jgi:hypothetical protein